MTNNNIFVCKTEAHVMNSLFIIHQLKKKQKEKDSKFNLYLKSDSIRLNKYDFTSDDIVQFSSISFPDNSLKLDPKTKSIVKALFNQENVNYFYFAKSCLLSNYLAIKFKKKGGTVSLVQDGTTAYFKPFSFPLKSMVLSSMKFLKFVIINKFKLFGLYWYQPSWGNSSYIDKIWATQPDFFSTLGKPSFAIFPNNLNNKNAIKFVSKYFKFQSSTKYDNSFFYINSPLKSAEKRNLEIKLLALIGDNLAKGQSLYVKFHPLSNAGHVSSVTSINNVNVVNESFPAELLILNMNRSIILSYRSSALLFNNPNCYFYWLNGYFESIGEKKYRDTINPTKHIKSINSEDELNNLLSNG